MTSPRLGAMTAAWSRARCRALEAIAPTGRWEATRWWMRPSSHRISNSRPASSAAACTPHLRLRSVPIASTRQSQYGSNLISIPAPGTEDDDHNPSRIAQRNLFDVAVGDDNLFHADRYKWSARLEVINLTNEYALYNFISTFSGTHYVSPRTVTGTIGFHF